MKWPHGYYRSPRTTQERRRNEIDREFVRGRRLPNSLAHAHDDKPVHHEKGWKVKRKTQYRCGGRGQEHNLYIKNEKSGIFNTWGVWSRLRKLEQYFDQHDIPYVVEEDNETYIRRTVYTTTRVVVARVPYFYSYGTFDAQGKPRGFWHYRDIFKDIPLAKPKIVETHWTTLHGYKVKYWTNKRLDLSFVEKVA